DGQPELQPELANTFGDDRAERVLERRLRDRACLLVLAIIARCQVYQLRHCGPSFPRERRSPAARSMGINGLYRVMIQGLLSVNRELAPAPHQATRWPAVQRTPGGAVSGETDGPLGGPGVN